MSLMRDYVLFPQLHRVNISEMLQFAPLGFFGSTELSLRRASALPPQFHRVSVIVTQERFHPALALFNCIWFWHWKHHKVPNYVAESFPKCQLHQIMTISQIQFMVKFSKDASRIQFMVKNWILSSNCRSVPYRHRLPLEYII